MPDFTDPDIPEDYEGDFLDWLTYAGIATFLGTEHTKDLKGKDLVIVGNPFDAATSNRPGARHGPRAVREQSMHVGTYGLIYPWGYDLREEFSLADYGDSVGHIGHGATLAMVKALDKAVTNILEAGANPLIVGGDHTTPYGTIPACAKKYGKLAMIHLDSHQDAIKTAANHVHHGSFAWDMVRKGFVDDSQSTQLFIRTLAPDQAAQNYQIIYANEARELGSKEIIKRIRDRIGDTPVYITLDIDALDPTYAPGTGTPVCGGPSLREVRDVLWGLEGLNVVGADVVEIAPVYDSPGQITALAGATIACDMLYLMAEARKQRGK